uniref:Response regulator n=1 Tax=Eiseniibacteriota bacterium TaxID=2212470 RepID=A0A832I887_UNCEI
MSGQVAGRRRLEPQRLPLLVVDDDRERAATVARLFDDHFDPAVVHGIEGAYACLGRGGWAAALVDYDLSPGASGIEFLQILRDLSPRTLRVLYSVYYSGALASDARRLVPTHAVIDARAENFLTRLRDAVLQLVDRSVATDAAAGDDERWFDASPASRAFVERLREAARDEAPVFLWGDHGSGKHFAARLLRRWREEWRRSGAPPSAPNDGGGGLPWTIRVPPLDERRQDIPALAAWALAAWARSTGEPPKRLAPEALDALVERPWTEGVLRLRADLAHAWKHAGRRAEIRLEDLPPAPRDAPSPSQARKFDGQRQALLRQLRAAGSVRRAVRLEGVEHANYVRLMRRLGIIRADTLSPVDDEPTGP